MADQDNEVTLFIPPSWEDQAAMDRLIDTLAEQPRALRQLRWLSIGGAITPTIISTEEEHADG